MDDSLSVKRRLSCMLAADAVGYSAHMAQNEVCTGRVLSAHRAVIDSIIAFHDGRIVNTAGDSVLAEFASAVEAVRAAAEIQNALKTRNESLAPEHQMLFRIGVNLGDVMVNGNDLLGDGVNIAARLQAIAEPGGICISSSVYDQITGKLDLGFTDIGRQSLKNIGRPIHVYRISGVRRPANVDRVVGKAMVSRKSWAGIALGTVGALVMAGLGWQAGWPHPRLLGTAAPAEPSVTSAAPAQASTDSKVSNNDAGITSGSVSRSVAPKSGANPQGVAPLSAHAAATDGGISQMDTSLQVRGYANAELARQRARSLIIRSNPTDDVLTGRVTPHPGAGPGARASDMAVASRHRHSYDVQIPALDAPIAQRGAPYNPNRLRH